MTEEKKNGSVDYVEFVASDFDKTKSFYGGAFGWTFQDWGDDYISFESGGLQGGFRKLDTGSGGGALVVLYTADLDGAQKAVVDNGGQIMGDILEFPGGRRFNFADPNGNVLAIWTDK